MEVENLSRKEPSKLAGKAGNLSELIAYQEGSVVSRALIDKKTGSVTLFAFDQGQGLSEHTAPYDALLYVLEGEAAVTVASTFLTVKEGEATLLPAHQPHALTATTKFKMLLTLIKS